MLSDRYVFRWMPNPSMKFTFLKHRGFFDLPITQGLYFPLPSALHVNPIWAVPASPWFTYSLILWRFLNRLSHPVDSSRSFFWGRATQISCALVLSTCPVIMPFFFCIFCCHSNRAPSRSGWSAAECRWLSRAPSLRLSPSRYWYLGLSISEIFPCTKSLVQTIPRVPAAYLDGRLLSVESYASLHHLLLGVFSFDYWSSFDFMGSSISLLRDASGLCVRNPSPRDNALFVPTGPKNPLFPPISQQPTAGIFSTHANRLSSSAVFGIEKSFFYILGTYRTCRFCFRYWIPNTALLSRWQSIH